ncbi:hypothetical protein ACFQ5Q_18435 [Luteolibacter ambystomatis]|uniref:hypothetical protein n=1 Tax=Luteolibacter ambystomatis TaxID=2824561 RepID=UPI00362C65F4
MHRLPSRSSVFRFRLASLLVFIAAGLFLAALGEIGAGLFHDTRSEVLTGLCLLGGAFVTFLIHVVVASRARCPLCTIPPLLKKGCQKSRKAKRFFGSYRLRVAGGILFRGAFQCPYCGEPTKLMVREKPLGGIDSQLGGTEGSGLR